MLVLNFYIEGGNMKCRKGHFLIRHINKMITDSENLKGTYLVVIDIFPYDKMTSKLIRNLEYIQKYCLTFNAIMKSSQFKKPHVKKFQFFYIFRRKLCRFLSKIINKIQLLYS